MYDEDGRKIDFGHHIGMDLNTMSANELDEYIALLRLEIERVEARKDALSSHTAEAEALFKKETLND